MKQIIAPVLYGRLPFLSCWQQKMQNFIKRHYKLSSLLKKINFDSRIRCTVAMVEMYNRFIPSQIRFQFYDF
ncbi:hypothetical protein ACH3XW_36000 [Acanthocheilonema viteae]